MIPSLLYRYYEMYRDGKMCRENWLMLRKEYLSGKKEG